MRKKHLFAAGVVIVLVAAVLLWRGSSLYTNWLMGQVASQLESLDEVISDFSRNFEDEDWIDDTRPASDDLDRVAARFEQFESKLFAVSTKTKTGTDALYVPLIAEFVRVYGDFDQAIVLNLSRSKEAYQRLSALQDQAETVRGLFVELLQEVPYTLISPQQFAAIIKEALSVLDYPLHDLRFAAIAHGIVTPSLGVGLVPLSDVYIFSKVKEDLVLDFAGTIQGATLPTFEIIVRSLINVPGDHIERLSLLDEVREHVINPDVKTRLNVVRQQLVESISEGIDISVVTGEMSLATRHIEDLELEIQNREGDVSRSVTSALERAQFHLKQAAAFTEKQNFNSAFGQAVAARVAAQSALLPFLIDIDNYRSDVDTLKTRFDAIQSVIVSEEISDEPILESISELEEDILSVSRLLETDADSARTFTLLEDVKIHLAQIEQVVREMANQRTI